MDVVSERGPAMEVGGLRFPTGGIVAALLAAWLGLMALAISNIAAEVDAGFKTWITLHAGIGPYSGKELFWLATWFLSWPVLHVALRNRDLNLRLWFGIFLAGMLVAVVLMWPPIFGAIAHAF